MQKGRIRRYGLNPPSEKNRILLLPVIAVAPNRAIKNAMKNVLAKKIAVLTIFEVSAFLIMNAFSSGCLT